jgi:hypothetical protein
MGEPSHSSDLRGRVSPVPVGPLAYKVVSSLSIEMASGTIPLKRLSFRPLHSAPIYVPMLRGRMGKAQSG